MCLSFLGQQAIHECEDSCLSEGEEVTSSSHYSSQLMHQQCFTRRAKCLPPLPLSRCLPFPLLLLPVAVLYLLRVASAYCCLSGLLDHPHSLCSPICVCHITFPREGVSLGQLVMLHSGVPVCLGPHCRALTDHWVPSEPTGG